MLRFGEAIRKLRLERKIGLREFAKKAGFSATYLSKMERGLDPPPVEEKITTIAKLLKADQYELLALAGKFPPVFKDAFMKNRVYTRRVPEFLAIATRRNLTDRDWKDLIEEVNRRPGCE